MELLVNKNQNLPNYKKSSGLKIGALRTDTKSFHNIFFPQLGQSYHIMPGQISEILIEFLTLWDACNVGVCNTDVGKPLHPLESSIFNAWALDGIGA